MCTIASIKLQVMVFSWFKLAIALYIFVVGIDFTSSTDLHQAFGLEYISYGLSLIFLGLLSAGLIIPQKFAVDRHNRFLLVVSFVLDTIVFAELINFGLIVASYMPPEFPKELQLDCLLNSPEIYSVEECTPFYESDRTAGMRLLWMKYFTDKANKEAFQVLTTIEGGTCCGFFQPFNCKENINVFPNSRLQSGIDSTLLEQRVTCGNFPLYYPQQSECTTYEDFAANPPIVGGCNYDLGIGFCLDVEITGSSLGCASAVEDYAVALIEVQSLVIGASSLMSLLFMTYACCMWWKRKEADIFPQFVTDVKTELQYKNVRDQFIVIPKKNLLSREGFLPHIPGQNNENPYAADGNNDVEEGGGDHEEGDDEEEEEEEEEEAEDE